MKTTNLHRATVAGLGMVLLALGGCGRRGPASRPTPESLFREGTAAYDARDYSRAVARLEPFVLNNIGDPRIPQARLTLGRARLARKQYVEAVADFERLVTDFPASPLALEGRFGMCDAYSRLSPRPQLDPEYTNAAIAHCESIVRSFPGTPQAEQAAGLVAGLRDKLAQKTYETGLFYFKRRAYDAAVIYFQDTLARFPTTTVAPTALLRMYESYQRIGYEEEAAEARARLLRDYASSPEARGLPQSGG